MLEHVSFRILFREAVGGDRRAFSIHGMCRSRDTVTLGKGMIGRMPPASGVPFA